MKPQTLNGSTSNHRSCRCRRNYTDSFVWFYAIFKHQLILTSMAYQWPPPTKHTHRDTVVCYTPHPQAPTHPSSWNVNGMVAGRKTLWMEAVSCPAQCYHLSLKNVCVCVYPCCKHNQMISMTDVALWIIRGPICLSRRGPTNPLCWWYPIIPLGVRWGRAFNCWVQL